MVKCNVVILKYNVYTNILRDSFLSLVFLGYMLSFGVKSLAKRKKMLYNFNVAKLYNKTSLED